MSDKKKVLIITQDFKFGGLNLVALRLQQALDKEKFECTFCVRESDEKETMEDYVRSTGVRIIYHPKNRQSYVESYRFYKELFAKEHFDIIHSHYPFYSAVPVLAAHKAGIKHIFVHSHFSKHLYNNFNPVKQLMVDAYRYVSRLILCRYATKIIACSVPSGEYLVGKKGFERHGYILNNAIETDKFSYDTQARADIRSELGIENKLVLGHVGALYYLKNQSFIIDVFNELLKSCPDSALVLVGAGEDMDMLKEKSKSLNIADKVVFTGLRDDVEKILSAMDCMIFPSLHEGFPLTLVEAQASGLPCVVSSTVTDKVKLNSNVTFMSLDDAPGAWADAALALCSQKREDIDLTTLLGEFDIRQCVKRLEELYVC